MQVHKTIDDLRHALDVPRNRQQTTALVPTMGALHAGHSALIRRAAQISPRVIVSIFVNPLQFGPGEDYNRYPRDLDRDKAAALEAGATDLFVPPTEELTQDGIVTVDPGYMGEVLCGRSRPGHFRGVATIVLKLFNLIEPTVAVFGWKDAQQLILIHKMVSDLNLPVEIEGVETVREPDGLAMSSRNAYLTPAERAIAPLLYKTLREMEARMLAAPPVIPQVEGDLCHALSAVKEIAVDYCELRSMADLRPHTVSAAGQLLLAAAITIGKTRLIDNVRFTLNAQS